MKQLQVIKIAAVLLFTPGWMFCCIITTMSLPDTLLGSQDDLEESFERKNIQEREHFISLLMLIQSHLIINSSILFLPYIIWAILEMNYTVSL